MTNINSDILQKKSKILPNGKSFTFHIVVSQWNKIITNSLLVAATKTLIKAGVKNENIIIWDVPGSFELIYGSKKAQEN